VVQNRKENVRVTQGLTSKGLDFETFVRAAMATGKPPKVRGKTRKKRGSVK
jgi:hypothetical protein